MYTPLPSFRLDADSLAPEVVNAHRSVSALCTLVLALALGERAHASAPATAAATNEPRLVWAYPRFRAWQYVSSVLVSGTNLYIEYGTGNFPDRRFNAPWPLDEPVRDALRADTADGRNVAGRWSDYFWHVPQYYSVLIDSVYVPLVLDDVNFEVAWQMTMLNWQAIGFAFFLTRVTHATVGRARPSQHRCVDDPTAENRCGSEGPSFFSGHTSMAATGAGLTCAHHTALPLYGGGWPDTAICVVMSTAAGVNGFLRIHSDRHWFSDVVVGYVLGWGIGFGVPWLLHYGRKSATAPLGAELLPKGVAIVPLAFEGGAGLGLTGAL